MSVPLNTQRRSELPLIMFTTCEPAAFGVALFGLFAPPSLLLCIIACLFSTIGMLASVGHLAKPLRAPRSLTNLRSSWLSREILAVGVFWAFLLAWLLTCLMGHAMLAFLLEIVGCLFGGILMYVIARAYRVSTRPAWCGHEGLMELWACAFAVGPIIVFACGEPAGALASAVFALSTFSGFLIDIASHHNRRSRLIALAETSDERIPLTLKRYDELWSNVKLILWSEGILCVLTIAVLAAAGIGMQQTVFMPASILLALGQIGVHAANRNVFYELPVPVRWVAPLRK